MFAKVLQFRSDWTTSTIRYDMILTLVSEKGTGSMLFFSKYILVQHTKCTCITNQSIEEVRTHCSICKFIFKTDHLRYKLTTVTCNKLKYCLLNSKVLISFIPVMRLLKNKKHYIIIFPNKV